jgi:monoamine oxidase
LAAATPQDRRRCSVAIVGAGIAGLAAARALRRAGIDDVRLFDLEDEPGGNSRGHVIDGIACPLGAHYLPLPGPDAHEVAELLHELGLARYEYGRSVVDERHLCHSPQERLWIDGQWHDGLLPPAQRGSARDAQYRRFARLVADASSHRRFALPSARAPWTAELASLDALPFARWLERNGLDDAALHWYLDYCCRDDYGAGSASVSAWAGLHYFASRHGFAADGGDGERDAVLTWPEGNAWLVRRLSASLRDRLHAGCVVQRVDVERHHVSLDVWHARDDRIERWTALHAIVATPLHVAARIVVDAPRALREAAGQLTHAPWLVANLHLHEPLTGQTGAPPSWDNVLFGGPSLGYVDAMHQSLRPYAGPTVLTAYWALGDAAVASRTRLLVEPWSAWARRVVDDLARAHPDLPRKVTRVDLTRHGHAMAVPAPGVRGSAALAALRVSAGRLHFAHGDLAGYSVFEEAFHHGTAAGAAVAAALNSASTLRSRPAPPAHRG